MPGPSTEGMRTLGHDEVATAATLRRFLLWLFLIGLGGAGAELFLLGHYEDRRQWAPLLLMASSLAILGWRGLSQARVSLRAFQVAMLLCIVSGFFGLWFHYQANVEFEMEMYPSLKGLNLFWEALQGATPALSPGTMVVLGLVGLAFTYRHPALKPSGEDTTDHKGDI
jgi:hypothetical protein